VTILLIRSRVIEFGGVGPRRVSAGPVGIVVSPSDVAEVPLGQVVSSGVDIVLTPTPLSQDPRRRDRSAAANLDDPSYQRWIVLFAEPECRWDR
jgi:hypothetical protein